VMGWIGSIALAVNVLCTILLFSDRSEDSNRLSVWLCSRNDAIGNFLVIIAAFLVHKTSSAWPDVAVAILMAVMVINSAVRIGKKAVEELKGRSNIGQE
jgi:Co/Zn/Cd efflux system component